MSFKFSPDVEAAIAAAAEKYGVPVESLRITAQLESRGNPSAQNPNSSAGGLFQFINSTANQYGLENKLDAWASADAGARLARDNASHLSKALGRDLTAGDYYLAHQQGAGGASRLLSNPNAKAVDIVGIDAVKLNGGHPDMTAGEFASLWIDKANNLSEAAPNTPEQNPKGLFGMFGGKDLTDEDKEAQKERRSEFAGMLSSADASAVRAPSLRPKDTRAKVLEMRQNPYTQYIGMLRSQL